MARIIEAKEVPIDSVKPYPGNARRSSVDDLRKSIRAHDQYRSIVVQQDTDLILAGNHTWMAAKAEGKDTIWIEIVEATDEEARKIVLVDNKSNDGAGYDNEALAALLTELGGDYEGTGFEQNDLDKLLDSLDGGRSKPEKEEVRIKAPERVSPGDVWKLGEHRLMCGSAILLDDLEKLMDGESSALIVTSPPYNQQLDSFKPSGMQKENPGWVERMASAYEDSMPEHEYQSEQLSVLQNLFMVSSDDGALFYNHKVRYREKQVLHPLAWLSLEANPWRIRQEIVWDRSGSITLNARMFMPSDERIYWMTRSGTFRFNDTAEIKAYSTVWQIAAKVDVQISAPFPTELPMRCILACTGRGDIVLDPYGGSGTTLIACEQLERRGFVLEVNPQYCDVILSRWEAFTGQTAQPLED